MSSPETAPLSALNQRIERADENENTIERFFLLDALLAERDWLEDELAVVRNEEE